MIDLEVKRVPENVKNFIQLAILKKFNNLRISSVDENFLCVFGQSEKAEDRGSAGFQITGDEGKKFIASEKHERVKHSKMGTVAMVNNGESFYITLRDGPLDHLDRSHTTIIGYVEEGREVLEKINATLCDAQKRPFNPIRIRHVLVLDDGGFPPPPWFPQDMPLSPLEIVDNRLEADEDVDERVLKEREKEAIARAQEVELELMGDLPSADIKPPNDVLFVCQLNPVTEDEDLKTVFARFGEIKKCEIIRDFKTGDSLQYAFIEFANEESCNKAYVAMQNVLVDDKRIKVDFSQSVSKMWNQYRTQGARRDSTKDRERGRRHEDDRDRERVRHMGWERSTRHEDDRDMSRGQAEERERSRRYHDDRERSSREYRPRSQDRQRRRSRSLDRRRY